MEYVTIKRFKRKGIGGWFNIPYGSRLAEESGRLFFRGRPVCYSTSYMSHKHFSCNADGHGLERGGLVKMIIEAMRISKGETPEQRDKRWNKIWNDPRCQPYRKEAQADHWLWNDAFYNFAPIEDLKYIATIVGARKGG